VRLQSIPGGSAEPGWGGSRDASSGSPIPAHRTDPWQGRVEVNLAGMAELSLDDLVERTVAVAEKLV
jgi:hypothetical protein